MKRRLRNIEEKLKSSPEHEQRILALRDFPKEHLKGALDEIIERWKSG